MAQSIFARTPGCLGLLLRKPLSHLKPSVMQRLASSRLSASPLLKNTTSLRKAVKSSPILNAVRSLRTSAVCCARPRHKQKPDGVKLWMVEKSFAVFMVFLLPTALMFPNRMLDSVVAVIITAHSYWGLEAIVIDYVQAKNVGSILPKLAHIGLIGLCLTTLTGLLYLIKNDVGLAGAIRRFWSVKSKA